MTIDELLALLRATHQKNLTPAQELVLRQAWEGQTYTSMAAASIYEVDYLKTTAARLWQVISQLFDKPITKTNFRSTLESIPIDREQRELIEEFSRQTLAGEKGTMENSQFLEYPTGPVPLDSIFYIPRPAIEELAYQEITKPGSVIRIKAPKETGKSSLLLRILAYAATLGYRTVNLDINQADAAIVSNLDKFLRWFCARVSQELKLQPNLDDYWYEDIGSKASCTIYFNCYLLEQLEVPLVLALNEVSRLFEYPEVAREFLPLLRSWYEEAQQVETWQKFRLIVLYSTEVYVPLNINQSPFNVGLPLKLPEFTSEQIEELARRHGLNWTDGSQAKKLMALVGGHPALVRLTLYHLANPLLPFPDKSPSLSSSLTNGAKWRSLEQLLQYAHTEAGIYREHLRRHWIALKGNPELAAAFKKLVTANHSLELDCIVAYKLESMGLVKPDKGEVTVSCELYRRYFRQQFLINSEE